MYKLYASKKLWQILIWRLLRQSAKPPNFLAIQYKMYMYMYYTHMNLKKRFSHPRYMLLQLMHVWITSSHTYMYMAFPCFTLLYLRKMLKSNMERLGTRLWIANFHYHGVPGKRSWAIKVAGDSLPTHGHFPSWVMEYAKTNHKWKRCVKFRLDGFSFDRKEVFILLHRHLVVSCPAPFCTCEKGSGELCTSAVSPWNVWCIHNVDHKYVICQ